MGSWGIGMQANDAALDAIAQVRFMRELTAIAYLTKRLESPKCSYTGYQEQLGLAEYLLDKNFLLLDDVVAKVLECIEYELTQNRLSSWTQPKERVDALKRFQKRLLGERVDPRDVMIDNMGLGMQFETRDMSRTEIKKKYIKKVKRIKRS